MVKCGQKINFTYEKRKIKMAITKKQKELDELKWIKSEELGKDACGTFDFCAECDKSLENPCDKAFKKFNKKAAPKAEKKECAKKACCKKEAEPVVEAPKAAEAPKKTCKKKAAK